MLPVGESTGDLEYTSLILRAPTEFARCKVGCAKPSFMAKVERGRDPIPWCEPIATTGGLLLTTCCSAWVRVRTTIRTSLTLCALDERDSVGSRWGELLTGSAEMDAIEGRPSPAALSRSFAAAILDELPPWRAEEDMKTDMRGRVCTDRTSFLTFIAPPAGGTVLECCAAGIENPPALVPDPAVTDSAPLLPKGNEFQLPEDDVSKLGRRIGTFGVNVLCAAFDGIRSSTFITTAGAADERRCSSAQGERNEQRRWHGMYRVWRGERKQDRGKHTTQHGDVHTAVQLQYTTLVLWSYHENSSEYEYETARFSTRLSL